MAKVLLVYDDYAELMTVETNLKKVGFDVVGLTNEYVFGDQLISLNPDVVVAYGQGPKVSSLNIGRKLKENNRWHGKTILIFSGNVKPAAAEVLKVRADLFLEAPVAVPTLVTVICELLGQDPEVFIERLLRNSLEGDVEKVSSSPMSFGKGGAAAASSQSSEGSVFVRGGSAHEGAASEVSGKAKPEFELFPDVDLSSLENELLGKNESAQGSHKKPEGFVISEKEQDLRPNTSKKPLFDTREVQEFQVDQNKEADLELRDPRLVKDLLQPNQDPIPVGPELTTLGEVSEGGVSPEVMQQLQNEVSENHLLSSEKRQIYTQALSGVKLAPRSTLSRVETRKRQRELKKNWDMTQIRSQDELRKQFVTALFKRKNK